jgi:hypothetical protein
MSEAAAAESPKVMEKVFNILKRELSAEKYLIYLQAITPRIETQQRNSGTLLKK